MMLPWPAKTAKSSLGGDFCRFHTSYQPVAVRGTAPVLSPARFRYNPPALLKLPQGPLDGCSGEVQVLGNGAHRGPAAALGVCPVFQVHIDGHIPVGQFGGVN